MPYSAYDSLRAYIHKQATGQAPPAPKSKVSQAPSAPSAPSAPTGSEKSVFEGASTGFGVGSDLSGAMPSPTGPASSPFMSGDYSLSTEGGFFGIGSTDTVNTEGVGEAISAGEAAINSPIGTYGMFDTTTTFGKALNTLASRVSPGFQAPVPASLFGGPAGMSVGVPIPGSAITGLFSGKVVSDPYGRPSAVPSGIYGKIAEMNIQNQYDIAQQVALGTPGYHQAYMGGRLVGLTPGPLGGYVVSGTFQGTPQQFMDSYAAMNGVDPKTADFSSRPGEAAFGTPLEGFVTGVGGLDAAGNFVSIAGETDTVMSADALSKQAGLVNDLFGLQKAMDYVTKANVNESVADSIMGSLSRGELTASAVTDKNGNVVGYETAIGGVVTDSAGNPVTSGNGNVVTTGAGLLSPQTYNSILANTGTPGVDAGPYGGFDAGTGVGDMSAGTIGEWTNFETAPFENIGVTGINDGDTGGGYTSSSPGGEHGQTMSTTGGPPQSAGQPTDSGGGDDGGSTSSSSPSSGSGMSPAAAGEAGAGDSAGDSGGCYITTATLNNTDEPDDGETLSTFRNFRDTYMMETPERKAKLKSYYENAPKVVQALDNYSEKDKVYQTMYDKFLKPAQYLINQGANEKAENVYDRMVNYAASNVKMAMAAGGAAEVPPVLQQNKQTTAPVMVGGDGPATEAETVADNIPADVEEGTFVLNAPAVEFAGSEDIKKMLLGAMEEAERQGIDITQNNTKMSKENLVSLVVSKKEVLIPPILAEIIGYDRLEKINNRGKKEVEKRIAENGQDIPPEAQQTASDGGTQHNVADTEVIDVYRSIVAQGGDAGRFQVFEKAFQEYQKGKAYRPMQSEIGTPEFDEEVRRKYGYAFPETEGGIFATEDRDAPLAKRKKKVSKPDSGEGFVPAP